MPCMKTIFNSSEVTDKNKAVYKQRETKYKLPLVTGSMDIKTELANFTSEY